MIPDELRRLVLESLVDPANRRITTDDEQFTVPLPWAQALNRRVADVILGRLSRDDALAALESDWKRLYGEPR